MCVSPSMWGGESPFYAHHNNKIAIYLVQMLVLRNIKVKYRHCIFTLNYMFWHSDIFQTASGQIWCQFLLCIAFKKRKFYHNTATKHASMIFLKYVLKFKCVGLW